MGCGSSAIVLPLPVRDLNDFYSIGLTDNDVLTLYKKFKRFDIQDDGQVVVDEFLAYLKIPKNKMTLKIFGYLEGDNDNFMSFREFVLNMWQFLTMDQLELQSFFYFMFHDKGDKGINYFDMQQMMEALHGHKPGGAQSEEKINNLVSIMAPPLTGSEVVRSKKTGLARNPVDAKYLDHVEVPYEQFMASISNFPSLMYPLFEMQHILRKKLLGKSFWEKLSPRAKELKLYSPEVKALFGERGGSAALVAAVKSGAVKVVPQGAPKIEQEIIPLPRRRSKAKIAPMVVDEMSRRLLQDQEMRKARESKQENSAAKAAQNKQGDAPIDRARLRRRRYSDGLLSPTRAPVTAFFAEGKEGSDAGRASTKPSTTANSSHPSGKSMADSKTVLLGASNDLSSSNSAQLRGEEDAEDGVMLMNSTAGAATFNKKHKALVFSTKSKNADVTVPDAVLATVKPPAGHKYHRRKSYADITALQDAEQLERMHAMYATNKATERRKSLGAPLPQGSQRG